MDTTASPRVLVIGLDPYRVPGPWDPEPVARAIESGLAEFAERGVGVETCLIGLDGIDILPQLKLGDSWLRLPSGAALPEGFRHQHQPG